jgi:amino-acid N-acetyltransferase
MRAVTQSPRGFSEREFYRREFQGRALAIALPRPAPVELLLPALAELEIAGIRSVLLGSETPALRALDVARIVDARDPRMEGEVWRALKQGPRAGVAIARDEVPAQASGVVARRLGVFKLVLLDGAGGLRAAGGRRLSFVHLDELAELLEAPAARLATRERVPLWRDIAEIVEAGVPAVNVCAPADLDDELFSYAGSGTLFTRECYMTVRGLGVDDYDAAHDLIARGTAEGYLALRVESEVDRILAHGLGAFVEDRDLAGIGALLPGGDGLTAEIAALYTLTRFLGEGVGGALVAAAVERAGTQGLRAVFACTTSERVGAFFERQGFHGVAQEDIPAARWEGYDAARRARVRCFQRELASDAGVREAGAGGGL